MRRDKPDSLAGIIVGCDRLTTDDVGGDVASLAELLPQTANFAENE